MQAQYRTGEVGSNTCPGGYGKITSAADCQTAAAAISKYWESQTFDDTDNPGGCFEDSQNGFVGLNSNAAGRGTDITAPLCKLSTTEAPILSYFPLVFVPTPGCTIITGGWTWWGRCSEPVCRTKGGWNMYKLLMAPPAAGVLSRH